MPIWLYNFVFLHNVKDGAIGGSHKNLLNTTPRLAKTPTMPHSNANDVHVSKQDDIWINQHHSNTTSKLGRVLLY